MGHLIAVIAAAFCFAPQDAGDVVRVSLRGGLEVEGSLLSVDDASVRLRVAGDVRTLDARDVLSVIVVSRGPTAAPAAGAPPTALERIRILIEKNDYDRAVKEIDGLLKLLGGQRTDVEALLRKSLGRTMDAHLAAQRATDALEAFRRATQWLSDTDVGDAFAKLATAAEAEAEALDRSGTAYARDLTVALAAEASKNQKLGEGYRQRAVWLVLNLADRLRDRRAFQAEAELLGTGYDLFPEARAPIGERRTRARLDYAESALAESHVDDALHETGQILAGSPSNARAREIFDRGRFQQVLAAYPKLGVDESLAVLRAYLTENPTRERADVVRLRETEVLRDRLASANRAEAVNILNAYLAQDLPGELSDWGRDELAKLQTSIPGGGQDIEVDVSEDGLPSDVARYFPFGKDTRYTFRRRDGSQITVTHDAVVRDGATFKIDYSLEEKSGDDRARHSFQQFVRPNEAYVETRGHKEVLLRLPTKEGDSWTWSIGDATYTRRVTSTSARDRVNEKDYAECLVVEFTTSIASGGQTITITSRSTYAPGVGLVRMEFVEPAYQKFSLELVSYVEGEK